MKKQWKSFFLKFVIITTSVYLTVFLYIEFFPNYYNNVNNTRWQITKNTLNKNIDISDTTISILFLGDSRLNAGIDLSQIPNSWSFASGGSTPVEMYFVLEKYLENYNKPDTIFLSISPRFLSEILAFWDYGVRNDFITTNNFIEIEKYNNKALGFCPKGKFLLYKLNFINFYQSDFFTNRVFLAKEKNEQMLKYILNHNGQRFHESLQDSCSEPNHETNFTEFIPSEVFDYYFNIIFETCQKQQIFISFEAMPMNSTSEKKLNKNFIKDYQKYIQNYQKKYPEFYISDTLLYYNNLYFGDKSHLNIKGQKKYTEYFRKRQTRFQVSKRHVGKCLN